MTPEELKNYSEMKKGFVNIHVDIETEQLYISNHLYKTIEDAEKGIFYGDTIEKIGCFYLEYKDYKKDEVR